MFRRSQGPRGLRRRSAAARLLRLRFRIPQEHGCLSWMLCVVRQISATNWSLVQRSPTECGLSNGCHHEAPWGEAMTRRQVEGPQE
jgi:hypothetical protein